MKIYTIVGTRPNFIKIDPELKQTIIHTGQHYDDNMSKVFFKGLKIPKPKYNLGCTEVGEMIDKLRPILRKDKPDLVIVFGDTNSSLAGALSASYEKIPVAHIEAGMRSRTNMPEEINRVVIDHLSKINFCATEEAGTNLFKEGLEDTIHLVGDPMFETFLRFTPIKKTKNNKKYILVTLHRETNANPVFMKKFLAILGKTNEQYIFPAHPRVKKLIKYVPKNVEIIDAVGYKEMLSLESNAKKIITDSGGVQREGAWMNIPVILMRDETEWKNLVKQGSVKLSNLHELTNDIINFKGSIVSAPTKGINKRIREVIFNKI